MTLKWCGFAVAVLLAGCGTEMKTGPAAKADTALAVDPGVKISSFGYDPEDSTRFLQAALDSGKKKLVLDKQGGPWVTLPLKMHSDTELVIEPGVELVAKRGAYKGLRDYLLELPYATNVMIRGGEGATLRMWKKDYQGDAYKHGEWRYALRIFHCRNVLVEGLRIVESGGDGIGVTGTDITIRNCVCDRNHRQGMSVFSVENLLVENCVFSNTDGTAPMAGVDLEPDRNTESLVNVVFRNCVASGNTGNGFEMYLNNLDDTCRPISITFENCRTVGNNNGLSVHGGSTRVDHFVKGRVSFSNCRVESPRRYGIHVGATPADAYDVVFADCIITNMSTSNTLSDVQFSSANIRQGPPDGIDLGNLQICQGTDRPWFSLGTASIGAPPRRITGRVTVVKPDGRREQTVIDAAWREKNVPVANSGKPLPPRVSFPDLEQVQIVDRTPAQLADLQPMTFVGGARLVFAMAKPGTATFVARQVIAVKGRKPEVKPYEIASLGAKGVRGKTWKIPAVSDVQSTFTFTAPKAGFYALEVPQGGTRFMLEKSSVPVGVNVTEMEHRVACLDGKPFSLWFLAADRPFVLLAGGDSYYRFKMKVTDSSGREVDSADLVESLHLTNGDAHLPKGLFRVDFARAAKKNYDWITLDLYGTSGFFFLNPDKSWVTVP